MVRVIIDVEVWAVLLVLALNIILSVVRREVDSAYFTCNFDGWAINLAISIYLRNLALVGTGLLILLFLFVLAYFSGGKERPTFGRV